ncbi:MAG: hypothetical protein ACTHKZ_03255 [Lysobacteraceae bacterium]
MQPLHSPACGAARALGRLAPVLAAACLAASCTTVGVHTAARTTLDYGPVAPLRVCVLKTPGVPARRVDRLVAAANREFAPYGLAVVVPWVRTWERAGFTHQAVQEAVSARLLEPPCDRLMAFIDRTAGDALWGLFLPEVLGSVDDRSHTHGFVVATVATPNQWLMPPAKATLHEFYHLLGCPHDGAMTGCYQRIAALKRQRRGPGDFLPGIDGEGGWLASREAVNRALAPVPEASREVAEAAVSR